MTEYIAMPKLTGSATVPLHNPSLLRPKEDRAGKTVAVSASRSDKPKRPELSKHDLDNFIAVSSIKIKSGESERSRQKRERREKWLGGVDGVAHLQNVLKLPDHVLDAITRFAKPECADILRRLIAGEQIDLQELTVQSAWRRREKRERPGAKILRSLLVETDDEVVHGVRNWMAHKTSEAADDDETLAGAVRKAAADYNAADMACAAEDKELAERIDKHNAIIKSSSAENEGVVRLRTNRKNESIEARRAVARSKREEARQLNAAALLIESSIAALELREVETERYTSERNSKEFVESQAGINAQITRRNHAHDKREAASMRLKHAFDALDGTNGDPELDALMSDTLAGVAEGESAYEDGDLLDADCDAENEAATDDVKHVKQGERVAELSSSIIEFEFQTGDTDGREFDGDETVRRPRDHMRHDDRAFWQNSPVKKKRALPCKAA